MSLEVVFFLFFCSFPSSFFFQVIHWWDSGLPSCRRKSAASFSWNLWKFPRTWYCFLLVSVVKKSRKHRKPWNWVTIPSLRPLCRALLSMRRASTIKSPTVSPWSSRTASSCCLVPLWSGSSAGTSTPEQRSCENWTTERNVTSHTTVAPLSGPTLKVFHDHFVSNFFFLRAFRST